MSTVWFEFVPVIAHADKCREAMKSYVGLPGAVYLIKASSPPVFVPPPIPRPEQVW